MKVFVISRGMPSEKYPLYGIFEFDQARALAESGVDTSMLVIDFRSNVYKRKYGLFSYERDGVKVFELSLPLGVYRRALPILQSLLLFLYKKAVKKVGKPDVIHAHFYSIAAIASVIKRKKKIPFLITEHSSKLNKETNLISALDKRLVVKAYSYADSIITVSKSLSQRLKENFGFDSCVVNNIVDTTNFKYVEHANNQGFVFVSVGNLIQRKGFDVLIKAFYKAFPNETDVFLNIVGEGEERNNLQDIINQYNIGDRVKLLGQKTRSELSLLMKDANAFALASRIETFGVVYIEAMLSGLPVVATICGGPENFVDETNGILIQVDDVESLANALTAMRLNIDKYDGAKISQECNERFSPQSIAKEIVRQYEKICN